MRADIKKILVTCALFVVSLLRATPSAYAFAQESTLASGTVASTTITTLSTSGEPTANGSQVPQVGVFVESLCPDSRRFFLRQLVPANREVGSIFTAKIIPFGHARVIGNNKMICQHGQRECDGNRKMACVLARARNQTEAIETLGCIFESLDDWRECVKSHMPEQGQNLEALDACSMGDESYKMMIEAEKATGRVAYIPHLTLNGDHSEDIQQELEAELRKTICQKYTGGDKPDACKQPVADAANF